MALSFCINLKSRNLPDQSLISASTQTWLSPHLFIMITVFTENCNLISQDFYDKTINSIDLCMLPCTCGHFGCLIYYGHYTRKVKLQDKVILLRVTRVFCLECNHTHALLLSSIVPYSQIPLETQVSIIENDSQGISPSESLEEQSYVDENNLRAILRSFRLRWKERLLSIPLLLSNLTQLVTGCFHSFSRQFMQIKRTRNKLFVIPT